MTPHPVLRAKTPEAERSAGREVIELDRFPFRVGRESRSSRRRDGGEEGDRRGREPATNELYLRDTGEWLQISREHFQIEQTADGRYELVERGSACGTIVDGKVVGGDRRTGRCPLSPGSTIVIGTAHSPFVFEFDVLE